MNDENVHWQSLQVEEEMEAALGKLRESVSNTEGVLHNTTTPNLKALEKMREVKDKWQEVTEGTFRVSSMELCLFAAAKKMSVIFF